MLRKYLSDVPLLRFAQIYGGIGLLFVFVDFLSDELAFGTYFDPGRGFYFGAFLAIGGASLMAHHLLFYRLLRFQSGRWTAAIELLVGLMATVGGCLFALLFFLGVVLYGSDEFVPGSAAAILIVPGILVPYGVALLLSVPLRKLV